MFTGDLSSARGRLGAWSDSLLVDHAVFRLPWSNFAEVIPGKLYRCNHPTPGRLAALKKRYGLKTLINLRGHRKCGSDALSREAANRLGLIHIDIAFESRGAPHRDRIMRFAEIYRGLQAPALMHCKSGADRAGLAAGLAILFEGGSSGEALSQLSWRFGHFSQARTGILDAFFRLYARDAEGRVAFLEWVAQNYDEIGLKQAFTSARLANFVTETVLKRE
jgi:protein tyrosine/serine phosphatase